LTALRDQWILYVCAIECPIFPIEQNTLRTHLLEPIIMLKTKLQALIAGIAFALAGICVAATPADKVAGKVAKPVEIEKNAKTPAAPTASAKAKNPVDKKKAVGGKRSGVPDDSI
jgi:hypothetical protein